MITEVVLDRIYTLKDLVRFSSERATATQIAVTDNSRIFVWGVKPGQEVEAHVHPGGQDTWIVIHGELTYYLGNSEKKTISAGQIDVAPKNFVHGCVNESKDNAIFVSIYSPKDIGFETSQK